ncbi:toxin YdaT family protein [Sodalis sp. C49]|uniref:toxin YdaT family protein n=1 Tax=Sodalis sp. C49 TaxID=3228929 RepID=UPI0039659C5F
MDISHQAIRAEIEAWAAERGQEYVAIEVCKCFFSLGLDRGSVRLCPVADEAGNADWKAIHNNRQQIFRWIRGDSNIARKKMAILLPAIREALPAERRARLEGNRSMHYLVSVANKEVAEAISAVLLQANNNERYREITEAIMALKELLPAVPQRLTTV